MKYLSLFSGIAGGDLGLQHFLGWRCMGYIELNEYCQKILRIRQDEGYLDKAPIFGDIRAFIDQGYAERYRGLVDVVVGGPPCQPFSIAGRKLGEKDPRNKFEEVIMCVRIIGPRYIFLENSPNIINFGYFGRILAALAEGWKDIRWRCLSAAELGAPYKRDRLWIYASNEIEHDGKNYEESNQRQIFEFRKSTSNEIFHDDDCTGLDERSTQKKQKNGISAERIDDEIGKSKQWISEPRLVRLVSGYSDRVERIKALGNIQVPIVAATAWRLLSGMNKERS